MNRRRSITRLITLLISIFAGQLAFSQTDALQQALQTKIDSIKENLGIPAMAFTCVLPDGVVVSVAAGMDVGERMLSGSTGKTFFAALALSEFSSRGISLDEKVSTFLSDDPWYNRIPNASTITLRSLLNHTSGIEEYYPLGDFISRLREEPQREWAPQELLAYVFDRQPLFAVGEGWSYADTNYILLGVVIEKLTGTSAFERIRSQFIARYELSNTEPSDKRKLSKLFAGQTSPKNVFGIDREMVKDGELVINPQFEWAGGGFVSNTQDLAKWARIYYLAEFLPEATRLEMRKGVDARTGRQHQYGLAMQIRPSTIGTSYGHGGWFPGYLTEIDFFPERNLSVAIQIGTDDFATLKRGARYYEMFLVGEVVKYLDEK